MMHRFLFLLGFLLFAINSGDAQCVSGDCQNGTGIFIFPSGAKYVGQFKKGKMDGIGTCYYTDGSKYQGHWSNSFPEGEGIRIDPDGTQHRGLWKRGKQVEEPKPAEALVEAPPPPVEEETPAESQPQKEEKKQQTGCVSGDCENGKGIYIYPSGAIYIGEFVNGEIHGIGACYYTDGSKYQGEWVHRFPEGRGTKIFPDGKKWTGRWVKGQPVDNEGRIVENLFPDRELAGDDAEIQSGCIEGDCQNGKGIFAYPDGSKYEGTFKNGKPNGHGTFQDINGERYVGAFKDGFWEGEGTLFLPDGRRKEGLWKQGEFVGKPESRSGCIAGNCQNGRGTFVFQEDGSRYEGAFKDGKPHGQGVMYYANGEKYAGQWKEGKQEGRGSLILTDGSKVEGYWANDEYVGEHPPGQENLPANVNLAALREAQSMKVWAVVVGIASYNHMPTLRYTDDDAYRIYAFLKSPEGGALPDEQIRLLIDEDATKDKITEAMRDVFMRAGPNDLVLLYYSGHGLRGAFLPIDFDGFNNRLEHEEVKKILDESPAKYKLVLADACHSGSLLAMKSGDVENVLTKYYTQLVASKGGTALIMSSKSEETSLESSGLRQGVFSHFLIRGLKGEADANKDQLVSIQELFNFISKNVENYTGRRQSPILEGDFDPNMPVSVVRK